MENAFSLVQAYGSSDEEEETPVVKLVEKKSNSAQNLTLSNKRKLEEMVEIPKPKKSKKLQVKVKKKNRAMNVTWAPDALLTQEHVFSFKLPPNSRNVSISSNESVSQSITSSKSSFPKECWPKELLSSKIKKSKNVETQLIEGYSKNQQCVKINCNNINNEEEWFCDNCTYVIEEGQPRYECPFCPDEFCLCLSCYNDFTNKQKRPHIHDLYPNIGAFHVTRSEKINK